MRQPYPSDMTDAQWELLEDLFPEAKTGRPREVSIRDVVDAIFYVNRTGVQWRYLPHDFGSSGGSTHPGLKEMDILIPIGVASQGSKPGGQHVHQPVV